MRVGCLSQTRFYDQKRKESPTGSRCDIDEFEAKASESYGALSWLDVWNVNHASDPPWGPPRCVRGQDGAADKGKIKCYDTVWRFSSDEQPLCLWF